MALFNDEGAQTRPCAGDGAWPVVRSKARPKKTLLVDKHAMVRESLLLLLDQRLPGQLWREAATLATALRVLRHEPDIDLVLIDLDLSDSYGLATLQRVREVAPQVPLLMLSADGRLKNLGATADHGATSFLSKAVAATELVAGVRRLLAGDVTPAADTGRPAQASVGQPAFTARQCDVLRLLIEGQSNKHIGRALGLTEATVKTHLQAVYRKLGVGNRTQAVLAAARRRLRV